MEGLKLIKDDPHYSKDWETLQGKTSGQMIQNLTYKIFELYKGMNPESKGFMLCCGVVDENDGIMKISTELLQLEKVKSLDQISIISHPEKL